LHAALQGHESCCLIGPPGTGKSELVKALIAENETVAPGSATRHVLGKTNTPNLMLSGVLRLLKAPPSARVLKQGGDVLMHEAAKRMAITGTSALAMDEAQHASATALFHLLLLRDICATDYTHPVAFVFIGTKGLVDVLTETGQLGQRVPIVVPVPLLDGAEVLAILPSISPDVARVVQRLGKQANASLERDLVDIVGGSVRRLVAITERAVRYATNLGVPLSEAIIRAAMDQQAD